MVDAAPTTRFERLRLVLVALSVLLPPVVLRVHLLGTADRGAAMPLDDLAGFIADFGVSGLVGVLLLLALRLSAGLGLCVLALWIAVNLVAYESIHALDALPSFRDAGYLTDATFLQGSGWGALRSGLALWVALASLGLGWAGRKAAVTGPYLIAAVVVCGLVLGLHSGLAWSPAVADWRQTHALLHNWTGAVAGPPPVPADTDLAAVASGLAADLSGEPRIGARPSAPNVLLVLVESISGAYLSTTAEAHGRSPRPSMPRLDAFAREHTAYATFLTHQINTNRGVYAALCGDLPKLLPGTPRCPPWRPPDETAASPRSSGTRATERSICRRLPLPSCSRTSSYRGSASTGCSAPAPFRRRVPEAPGVSTTARSSKRRPGSSDSSSNKSSCIKRGGPGSRRYSPSAPTTRTWFPRTSRRTWRTTSSAPLPTPIRRSPVSSKRSPAWAFSRTRWCW